MASGGGKQTTTNEPWKGAQPYLQDIFRQGQTLAGQPTTYFPGATTVPALDSENAAFQQRNDYNSQVYGGQNPLQYGQITGALGSSLAGNTTLGNMANSLAPQATDALSSGFKPTDTSGIAGLQIPQAQIGQYGFGTSLDPSGKAPTFGTAGGLDARGAYQSMLTGQPDYQGLQGAIDAANAPILRQLEQEIIPGLNQNATFTNNSTGGIKALNRVLPEVGERMALNAQSLTNQERLRALDAQERAAGAISQGGLQSYGLGLDTASREAGLGQNLAQLGLQTDATRAGFGLDAAGLGLQREGMIADQGNRYRSDLLNYGSLAGQLGGQQGAQSLTAAGLSPAINEMGRQGGDDAMQYAAWQRGLAEDQLAGDMDRFNYMRDQPYNQLGWYSNLVGGLTTPYGQSTTTGGGGSRASGVLGGAASGAAIGSIIPGLGTGLGAIAGGLLGAFG